MSSRTIEALLNTERLHGNTSSLTREKLLEHFEGIENMRVNYLSLTEKKPLHNPYKHGKQIAKYALNIAKELHLSEGEAIVISCAARFHDIGKIKIDYNILNKPDKLNDEEYEKIKMHSVFGYDLMLPYAYIGTLIKYHHERFDGSGYPEGLKGNKIPLGSRIISVIDAFNAMTHKRPYNNPINLEEAMNELEKNAGTQFDPEVVKIFLSILSKEKTI